MPRETIDTYGQVLEPRDAPWNRTCVLDARSALTLPRALARVADTVPDRIALVEEGRSLTYRELVDEVNRTARAIPVSDHPGQEPVVVTVGHGIDPLVQILAVLHAGRIVLPLDVHEPTERLASVYHGAAASAVLTSRACADVAAALAGDDPVVVYEDITATDTTPLDVEIRPSAIASVFYTSGSTGTPKGVVDDHHGMVHHGVSYASTHGITPDDRLALTNSLAFAGMRSRLLGGLMGGAAVYTYDLGGEGLRGLRDFVVRHGITVLWFTPSMLRALNGLRPVTAMPTVRLVALGSETLFGSDVNNARAMFGEHTAFWNRLASSEAHAIAAYEVPSDVAEGPVPVGVPLPWVSIRIVDEDGDDVPDGSEGRLVAVNPHSAIGYWNDPELTAQYFFTTADGRRGFRTSDAVRRRPDGLLEHLGRLDDRVKIRGAMVSPGEVERALARLPGVASTAVVARHLDDRGTRLVGFVEPDGADAPTARELRRGLRDLLPSYMVPASIEVVDVIPRTPRGKVDRNRARRRGGMDGSVLPRSRAGPRERARGALRGDPRCRPRRHRRRLLRPRR